MISIDIPYYRQFLIDDSNLCLRWSRMASSTNDAGPRFAKMPSSCRRFGDCVKETEETKKSGGLLSKIPKMVGLVEKTMKNGWYLGFPKSQGYPQFSSIYSWDFSWNWASYFGVPPFLGYLHLWKAPYDEIWWSTGRHDFASHSKIGYSFEPRNLRMIQCLGAWKPFLLIRDWWPDLAHSRSELGFNMVKPLTFPSKFLVADHPWHNKNSVFLEPLSPWNTG